MNKRECQKQLSAVKKLVRGLVNEKKLQEGVKYLFDYCYKDCDFIEVPELFTDNFILGSDAKILVNDGSKLTTTGDIIDINNVNDDSFYQWKTFVGGAIEIKNLDAKYIKESLRKINFGFDMW